MSCEKPISPSPPDWIKLCLEGGDLDDGEAAELGRSLAHSPNDAEVRVKRLGFRSRRQLPRGDDILWLTIHRPDIDLGGFSFLPREQEPDVYDLIRQAWDAHLQRAPDDLHILHLAAQFAGHDDSLHAESLLRRGAALAPEEPRWLSLLGNSLMARASEAEDLDERTMVAREALALYEGALSLETTDLGRHLQLCDIARAAIDAGRHERAAEAANQLLAEAERFRGTWQYGNALHLGNIVLGKIALASGDVTTAGQHLILAADTPGSPQLNSFGPDLTLAKSLLTAGATEPVVAYLTACAKFWRHGAANLSRWIARICAGEKPSFEEFGDEDDGDE